MTVSDDALTVPWTKARQQNPALAALLFDLDGTLVDTMSLHYEAYARVFSHYGGAFSRQDFDHLIGPPAGVTIPLFAKAAGVQGAQLPDVPSLHAAKKAAFEEILHATVLDLLPAARLLMHHRDDFQIAVVTSGNAAGAQAILKATGLWDHVEVVVSGDDVAQGKPHPEPYLRALDALGREAGHSLAFEDHDNGIEAATRAGMPVIDVRVPDIIPAAPAP